MILHVSVYYFYFIFTRGMLYFQLLVLDHPCITCMRYMEMEPLCFTQVSYFTALVAVCNIHLLLARRAHRFIRLSACR